MGNTIEELDIDFLVDVGILIDQADKEFECYNDVYDKSMGFMTNYNGWKSLSM